MLEMLGDQDKNRPAGGFSNRKPYLRSVSWTDRSPTKPSIRPQPGSKAARSCLPPLQPLSIARRRVEEWPKAGSDDLGVWPNPQTPRGSINVLENSNSSAANTEPPVREFQFKRDKLAFFDKECSRIADHVYLGSDAVAKNREILRQNGITHVLNCVGFVCPEYFKNELVYKTLWLQDSPSEDITSILYNVFDYFEDVREQGGRVLVHCCQGVSRSTSLVIAYLMWREGQSYEEAFQYVKAARGVTNPNMGFACQLLQCQKRVHAVPASPNSMLRMYRLAPHSPYDPLHLVPKMLNQPGVQGLDSRGAFIVLIPSAIYVWTGKNCNSVMSISARAAADQFIRYESAKGPIMNIREGEERTEFWDAISSGQLLADNQVEVKKEEASPAWNDGIGIGERKVDKYDLDFEIFHKAIHGGVVPPLSVSHTESETCLPARENGWGRLRRKFANGIVKEFLTSSKVNCDTTQSGEESDMIVDTCKEVEQPVPAIDPSIPLSPSSQPCGSTDSFSCFPNGSPDRISHTCKEAEHTVPAIDILFSPTHPCGSPDSFSHFLSSSPKFSSKSPTLSPSTSDYSSSFNFSPSSSNWSDLSYLSSRQPSPSGLESSDPFFIKNVSLADNVCFVCKETSPSPTDTFTPDHYVRAANTCFPCKGTSRSIAERRGSNPPPRMLLPSVDESSQAPKILERSWSFSLPDLDDDVMKDADCNQVDCEGDREEIMLDANIITAGCELQSGSEDKQEYDRVAGVITPVLYSWPSMNKVELHSSCILDSRSVYILLAPDASLGTNNSGILYVWLGCEVSHENEQSQLISYDDTCKDSNLHWKMVGQNFLDHMGLPANSPVQIIREGEEPEQFLNHLNSFSFQRAEDSGHN